MRHIVTLNPDTPGYEGTREPVVPAGPRNAQRDPEETFCISACFGAWGAKAKKPHNLRNILFLGPCRGRRQAKQHHDFMKMCVLLAFTRPKNNFGLPLRIQGPGYIRESTVDGVAAWISGSSVCVEGGPESNVRNYICIITYMDRARDLCIYTYKYIYIYINLF